MGAETLRVVFDSVYMLSLASWLGSILFFSFAIAPLIFKILDQETAGRFLRAFFPRYYIWGAISGALALPCLVGVPLAYPEHRGPWVGVQALAIVAVILLTLYSGNSLTPAINAARDLRPEGEEEFSRLHRRSVWLNGVVMLVLIGLVVAFVTRPDSKTRGIVEPTPVERMLLELKRGQTVNPARSGDSANP